MTRYVHHQHATCARVSSVLVKIERAFGNESPRTTHGVWRLARRHTSTNGAAASVTRVFIIFNDLYPCASAGR